MNINSVVPAASFPFFRLPRELRDRIYRYALIFEQQVCWPNIHKLSPTYMPSAPGNVALLRASRALYNETAPLLYTSNRFIFLHPSDANMFRHTMDSVHTSIITSLVLRIRDTDLQLWTSYLGSTLPYRSLQEDFPSLRTLIIQYRSSFWLTPTAAHIVAGGNHHGNAGNAGNGIGNAGVLENYLRWHRDPGIENICLSVYSRTAANVRVVVTHRITSQNIAALVQSYPNELSRRSSGEASTEYRRMYGLHVRLELHPSS